MTDEEIEKSIKEFYAFNNINPDRCVGSQEEAYLTGSDYEPKVEKQNLKMRMNEWLTYFEEEDKYYFLQLFEKFIFYTQKRFDYEICKLSEYVFSQISKNPSDQVAIVFSESGKGYKSGASEMISAWWKACEGNMKKSQLLEIWSKVSEDDLVNMDAIVFIDDIVATGFTLKNTIKTFFKRFPLEKFVNTQFYATGLIATRRGKRMVTSWKDEKIKINWIYEKELQKSAFSNECFSNNEEASIAEEKILEYEKIIGKIVDGKKYVMGFAESKLLVAFRYETPNNTLSTFWRYGDNFIPLFERSSNQILSLDMIKKRKKEMADNAYKMKGLINETI